MAHPDDLITQLICDLGYDEAEKVLRLGPAGKCGNSTAERLFEWIGAEEAIEKIVEARESESRRKNHGWISVKDRLPEPCKRPYEHDTVLVWTTDQRDETRAREGYYIHELKQWRIGAENGASTVTHWQPLPAPPAQQSEERAGKAVAPSTTQEKL